MRQKSGNDDVMSRKPSEPTEGTVTPAPSHPHLPVPSLTTHAPPRYLSPQVATLTLTYSSSFTLSPSSPTLLPSIRAFLISPQHRPFLLLTYTFPPRTQHAVNSPEHSPYSPLTLRLLPSVTPLPSQSFTTSPPLTNISHHLSLPPSLTSSRHF
ncbi:hypothetical protein E2C01_013957 [Portunus trituberculatus]|uniref:Uncharacterized protein n=1 Tax=Portunus trituberculatus TaxID=210409 RepID=A0A5B7DIM6_PORTR|nr:hypothetical protein [Portunus trituberculatus]